MGVTPPGPVEGDTAPRPSPDPVPGQPDIPTDSDLVTVAQLYSINGF